MANTFTKIYIHLIFAVKGRENLIHKPWKDELYKYITGIVKNNGHKLIAINGMPDHVHILIGLKPIQSISDLMQNVKGSSSKWINEKKFIPGRFNWQEGYGAFSYSDSQLNSVVKYIDNQAEHHKRRSFSEEYIELLERFGIKYNPKYILNEVKELYRP